MKNNLISNLHIIIIIYALFNLYSLYEEREEELGSVKQAIPSLEAKLARTKKKLRDIKRFKANLKNSKQRVEEVVKQIERVQRQLPSDIDDTKVATQVIDLAKELKIVKANLTPKEEKLNGFYFTKNYTFKGQGTYLQSMVFFENLERSERILNVKNILLETTSKYRRGKFQVLKFETDIESYRYNIAFKEKSGVKEIENKFKVR
ncbi:MAG: type 4a pilus biogenesis protein PilO [Bacteriovoracaceae bacterium]|jgi:Tfp pilus assembly protein PilO|nr:type 4a pilus biogenesis protein PilO [Bacteriovoracaceae bacterium]